jgi:pimeloyl-[acyl-carrier protein] methyl ester esterase
MSVVRAAGGTGARAAADANAPVLHVESVGAGEPLLVLHGFAMHGGLFAPVLPALAAGHRVHVVDLPGHGRSPPVTPFTLDRVADAVRAVVHGVGRPATVLGWSFGGQVALALARNHPDSVARLVLVCTTPSFVTRPGWSCAMTPETLRRFGDELAVAYKLTLQRFLTLQVQGSEAGRATLAMLRARLFERGEPSREVLDATLRVLRETDLRDGVRDIRTPALVVSGTRDTLAPAAAGRWLAGHLAHATYVEIEGAAHAPFLSHPQAFAAALTAIGHDR